MPSTSLIAPGVPDAPISPALLAQMATAFFTARPGEAPDLPLDPPAHTFSPDTGWSLARPLPAGVQAPANGAPAGSPLSSPAGLGPGVPGTPIPMGQMPGTNLLPAS